PFGTIALLSFFPSQTVSTSCGAPGENDPMIVRTVVPPLSLIVIVYRSGLASPIVLLRMVVVGTVEVVPGAITGVEFVSVVAVGAVLSTVTETEVDPELPLGSVNDALTRYVPSGTRPPDPVRPSHVTEIGNGSPVPLPENVRTTWLALLNTSTF